MFDHSLSWARDASVRHKSRFMKIKNSTCRVEFGKSPILEKLRVKAKL
jgi:hypothetical protein